MVNIPSKENKNVEFKEKLNPEIHLRKEKKQHLATQMKFRLETGKGAAVYIIGVSDEGKSKGITDLEFEETVNVLRIISAECNAKIEKIERYSENGNLYGKILISRIAGSTKNHIVIGVAGHVHHGKSTLIATLLTGKPDTKGNHWLFLNVLPHEIERRLSADLHYAIYGFKDGNPITLKNPLDKKERSSVVEKADKMVSFVDTVGHDLWLRTTIRGLVGQNIDYGLIVVASDDGVTHITKEHLGLLLALDLPLIVCITKIDKVGEKRINEAEKQVEDLLKHVGRIPFNIRSEKDLDVVLDKLDTIVPIIRTSSSNMEGFDFVNKLIYRLPERKKNIDEPFLMFIDRIYNVTGAGTVVSGTIKQGVLKAGQELTIGPDESGGFKKVRAPTIEMYYHPLEKADAGSVVGIAVKGIKFEEVKRGMVLCSDELKPKAVKSFEAEIVVLNHPTRIASGYEPIFHCNTVAETVKLELLDREYLKSGELGRVKMTFRYQSQFVREGDKFVFREGKTKGIGTITKIEKFV